MPCAVVFIGLAGVIAGSLVAACSGFLPRQQRRAEEIGGGLFLAGLVLIGAGFPII